MDIHRCRFVPYPPSTINSLAFSHSQVDKKSDTTSPRLAVGRANGDIEIWNPLNGSWLQETIIRGGKDRSIDGLVWIQDPSEEGLNGRRIAGKSRLFSVGYTTTVTEWDLEKSRPLRQAGGNHGEIWCLAAQPPLKSTKKEANGSTAQWEGQNLVTGCTDGALVLYSTKDDDLQLQKVLVRPSAKRAKIISVAFQDRNIVVAGCTDSTIRVYDIRGGQNLANMSLGAGPKGGPKEIIVWAVKVLQTGNIVSGDSTGELKIWDSKTYTLMQRIHGHRADVLSLATNSDGSMIFSGGMDRRTVAYRKVGKGKERWAEIGHRRYHKHDVKTMASFESRNMSIVVSGGPDAAPTVLPLRQFGMENQRSLPFLSQQPALRSSPKKRLILSFWEREVHIWRIAKGSKPGPEIEESENESALKNKKLVAKILIKGEANITSVALSVDGDLLAVSTVTDVKVFQLRARKSEEGDGLRVSKVDVPSNFSLGARFVQFSPDRKWLCIIRPDSRISLARLLTSASSAPSFHSHPTKLERINRKIEKHITLGGLGNYDRTITQAEFSSDSRILAVSDLAGYIDTYVLSGQEDLTLEPLHTTHSSAASSTGSSDSDIESDNEDTAKPQLIYGQHWARNPSAGTIPKLPSAPTVLSFRPSTTQNKPQSSPATHAIPTRHTPHPISHTLPTGEDRLLVVTATSEIFEFDVLRGALSSWSRRNPTSLFPDSFRRVLDLAKGCVWDVSKGRERVWLYGVAWLWMFDLARDFPLPSHSPPTLAPVAEDVNLPVNGDGNVNGNVNGNGEVNWEVKENANANANVEVNGKPESKNKKRKRRGGREETSGAGGSIPNSKLTTGISRKMQHIIHEELHEIEDIPSLQSQPHQDANDNGDDAMDIDSDSALVLRRNDAVVDDAQKAKGVHYWQTYKYRPVLGICVIGELGESEVGPEVVIVERPIWEVGLGPRFEGDQEWEKNGL